MGMSDLILPNRCDSYRVGFYEASKDPPVEAIEKKECGCYKTVKLWTNCYLYVEHMRKHLTPVSTIKQEGSTESCKEVTMNDALTDFVDQLNVFPALEDFNASSTSEALKWTDLVKDAVY